MSRKERIFMAERGENCLTKKLKNFCWAIYRAFLCRKRGFLIEKRGKQLNKLNRRKQISRKTIYNR